MSGVFINYRGEDSETAAALIDRKLAARLGSDRVFLDSRSIPADPDFSEELPGQLRGCRVLVVVIGPRWLTLTDAAGRRRIDDPRDRIRREVADALSHGLRVIPVQVTLTPPRPDVTPEHPADHQQALDWFTTERPVLLAAVDRAAAVGFDTHTWQLAWALVTFLIWRGHWHDLAATSRATVTAAQRLADLTVQARGHRNLANAYTQLGRFDEAHTHLHLALDLSVQTGDQTGQAHARYNLTHLCERRGDYAQALDHARQALDLHQATGNQNGQAQALNAVGWCHALLGDHQQALTYCQQALTLSQEIGGRVREAAAWGSLGYAHHHLGNHPQAFTSYQRSRTLFRDLGARYNEAEILTYLGDAHHTTGNLHAARDAWQQALAILDDLNDLNDPDAGKVRTKLATRATANPEPADSDARHDDHRAGSA